MSASRGVVCSRGGSARGGGCLLPEGLPLGGLPPVGLSAPGRGVCLRGVSASGCLLLGVSAPRGVSAPGGVCLLLGGGCLPLGGLLLGGGVCSLGGVVSQHALRQTPPCEQNDKQVQKYYLGHNFVATGNNESFTVVFNIFKNNI